MANGQTQLIYAYIMIRRDDHGKIHAAMGYDEEKRNQPIPIDHLL